MPSCCFLSLLLSPWATAQQWLEPATFLASAPFRFLNAWHECPPSLLTCTHMAPCPQELECGRLFPRFQDIKNVSAKLAAATADFMVSTGLGTVPADFDAVVRAMAPAQSVTSLARWEAYVRAHMFNPDGPRL